MTAETARKFEALEAQATRIMGVFTRAGYEAVAPAVIQPASIFLDGIGEALRARTYVFTDQDGAELCLRPDLTVPTCRLHLERVADATQPAKYCYNGAAFRYQPAGADSGHPREFRQAGIESIGRTDTIADEADTLAVMIDALAQAGLDRGPLELRFGDLRLVRALIDAVAMPSRWKRQLKAKFWRPQAFRAELKRLSQDPSGSARALPVALIQALQASSPMDQEAVVAAHLEAVGREAFGARTLTEIGQSVRAIAADARATPLDPAIADLINGYLSLTGPAIDIVGRVRRLAAKGQLDHNPGLVQTLADFEQRLDLFKARDIDLDTAIFSGEFGRSLEYYTGFVFEISVPGLSAFSPVVGGGRYDGLMRLAGSPRDVPAVGAAIHTERLLSAIVGGRP